MANRIDLSNILINFLKKARYERHIEEGTLEENQFYAVTDGNEKTEYGDLFGNIENQADLYNALYASRLFKMEMCNDVRGYDIVHRLYDRREFDLSKFTVVGNPVISKDGIASGFSGSNYLTVPFDITKSFELKYRFKHTSSANQNTATFLSLSVWQNAIISTPSIHSLWLTTTNPNFTYTYAEYGCNIQGVEADTWHNGYLKWDGETYTFGVEGKTPQTISSIYPPKININKLLYLGGYRRLTEGELDLKDFSITVDGTEVFNGLKDLTQYDTYTLPSSEVITIPYIPSVDGVKIVDVAYKPLVDQLYTETGMGNYIIIDETNKTFRLPLPDIYSQIEKKTSFTLRKWED